MNQHRRLQHIRITLPVQIARGNLPQMRIDQWHQHLEGRRLAVLPSFEQHRNLTLGHFHGSLRSQRL